MQEILAHLVGDYILQSDWMAQEKTRSTLAAASHAVVYGLPFIALGPSAAALLIIIASHLVIDRMRLARYVVFGKNFLAPRSQWPRWERCRSTGYDEGRPAWLAVWLLIIADNTIHLLINHLALRYT